MDRKFLMEEMTWPEFGEAIKDNGIVIVPIGSTEQHGPHLPLGTDTLIGFEIAKRAAQRISQDLRVIVAPPTHIGLSPEHLVEFPGSLSFKDSESLISYTKNICENLVLHGAKKIVIWNMHGGNSGCLMAITSEVRRETGAFVVMVEWFQQVRKLIEEISETDIQIHADESETSIMLFLFPQFVQMDKAQKELPEKFMKSKYIRSLSGPPYPSWLTKDVSKSGIIGDPTKASKDKGEKIVEGAIKEFCELLKELATW